MTAVLGLPEAAGGHGSRSHEFAHRPPLTSRAVSDDARDEATPMLRITGGKVYDPANGIDGVVKDLCIDDRAVSSPTSMERRPHDRRDRDD